MSKLLLLLIPSLLSQLLLGQSVTISGIAKEKQTGEIVPYVAFIDSLNQKGLSLSNSYGFFSFTAPAGKTTIIIVRHLGYETLVLNLHTMKDSVITIEMVPSTYQLAEIIVAPDPSVLISRSSYVISTDLIKQAPALLGEKDALKIIQLLPGIQRAVEGSTAFYVRGGGADQNLIIVDDVPIYNANHLFGFMSAFNSDAIKNISFFKGSFPARYGGRVSSVTDIQTKDGDKQSTNVVGGVGLLSARLTLDGPIVKNKSSYLVSARRSFLDLIVQPFMSKENKELYRLIDVTGKADYHFDTKNALFVSGFMGGDKLVTKQVSNRDQYSIKAETALGWENKNASLRWNHIFSEKIFSNLTFIKSHYNFYVEDSYERKGINPNSIYTELVSSIDDYSIKKDVDYFHSNTHTFRLGTQFTRHNFSPRIYYTKDKTLGYENEVIQKYRSLEFASYVEDSWRITENFSVDLGLRHTLFQAGADRYSEIEPRVHAYYVMKKRTKISAGYTRSNQFLHLLSNTGVGLPTDLWVPATAFAPPQQGDFISAGIFRSFGKEKIHVSIETYRRFMRNLIAYSPDAEFLDIDDTSKEVRWEENIAVGKGESYGTEIFIEKPKGSITGWISYTLAWAIHQFDQINNGRRFFPKYDSRHNAVLYINYRLSEKIVLAANWLYSSGNAFTVPQAYYYGNFATGTERITTVSQTKTTFPLITENYQRVPYFGSKNSYRSEAYHRLDISIQFHKKKKKFSRSWEFGLYNAYNRKNPLYYYLEASNDFSNSGQRIDLKKKSLFPILPSITYDFKF